MKVYYIGMDVPNYSNYLQRRSIEESGEAYRLCFSLLT